MRACDPTFDVVEGLQALVKAGLAKAYNLSAATSDPFSCELQAMPPLDVPEEHFRTYFHVTKMGMDFQRSDGGWWPLDDDGLLRSDWKPPQD